MKNLEAPMETKVVMVDVIEVESGASIAMPWDVMLLSVIDPNVTQKQILR